MTRPMDFFNSLSVQSGDDWIEAFLGVTCKMGMRLTCTKVCKPGMVAALKKETVSRLSDNLHCLIEKCPSVRCTFLAALFSCFKWLC